MDVDAALGPRERTMLAALIVRRGQAVAPGELAEAWWGEQAPPTWAQQVRNSIARIRARLGRDAVETIGTQYRLGLDAEQIDAVRFEALVVRARAHAVQGDDDRAIDAYRRGLALWRGAAYPELAEWEPGAVEAGRLQEVRLAAEEELLDARLRVGEHRTVLPEAERLVREDALREDRWAILALAAYRSDRQAEALGALRAARRRLDEELGIEPGARLTALEKAILRQDPGLMAPEPSAAASIECPYPGLRPFGPEDAELFFGRDDDIDAVLDRVRPGEIVVVAGPSGTGKSSLVLAGVAPRLIAAGRGVEVVLPGRDAPSDVRSAAARARVVIVDQAEELLAPGAVDGEELGRACADVLADGTALVFTVRSDGLDALRALPRIGDAVGSGVLLLGPLSAGGFREAIETPARLSGLRVEAGLIELALRDLGDRRGTLPHLSHVMRETWRRREGGVLTVDGYEASGGIAGAIAQSAESVYRSLDAAEQQLCRALMLRLVARGADGVSTRRRVASAPLLADAGRRALVERLARARLLTVDESSVVVAHEAVATAWPRLDGWLAEDADHGRVARAVESAAEAWDADGRSDADLWRGARLHTALAWRAHGAPDLTEVEADFLESSRALESADADALAERARRDRRQNRRLRWALGGAAGLLVVSLAAGVVAVGRSVEARAAAEDARVEALVATSLSLRASDRAVAALLAAEAHRRWPDDGRVRSALWGIATGSDGLVRTWVGGDDDLAMAPIPGTRTAVMVRGDPPRVTVVDMDTGAVVRELEAGLRAGETRWGRTLAVSEDGRTVVVQTPAWADPGVPESCCVNVVEFVDLDSGERLAGSDAYDVRTTGTTLISPDGTHAYVGHPITGDLMRFSGAEVDARASSPAAFEDYTGEPGRYDAISWLGTGDIAVGRGDSLAVYDPESLEIRTTLHLGQDLAEHALSALGDRELVVSGSDGIARVDAVTGDILWRVPSPGGVPCFSIAVEREAGVLHCAQLGVIRHVSLETGAVGGSMMRLQSDTAGAMTILDDSSELFITTGSAASLWRTDGSGAGARMVAAGRVPGDDFGLDDTHLVTMRATDDGEEWMLWDLATDRSTGDSAEYLAWLDDRRLVRFDDGSPLAIADARTGAGTDVDRRLAARIAEDDGWAIAAPPGPDAFAVLEDGLAPFDPATGQPTGRTLRPPWESGFGLNSVTQSADGTRAAVTWFNIDDQRTQTTIFDPATGVIVADGFFHSEGARYLPDGDLLVVSDDALTRHEPDTLEPVGSLPKPFGGGTTIQVAADGRTVMVTGWDNRVSLYDLAAGVMLGDPLDTTSPIMGGGAQLSHDGRLLAAATDRGVVLWDLDPAAQAEAACAVAGRELTEVEWQTYFGEEPQRPTCGA